MTLLSLLLCLAACSPKAAVSSSPDPVSADPSWETIRWDFDNANGWGYSHQDDAPMAQWWIEDGRLKLKTRAGTRDRSKMHTLREDFTEGIYTWRIFLPQIAAGEQVSVAGFIYRDDAHELDFEIGYGTAEARSSCGAKPGELVACMTNQGFPNISNYTPVSTGWHDFSISLADKGGKYDARWLIDGKECQRQELLFGNETSFRIMCSVENLLFIGDHIPEYDTVGMFDFVSFTGPAASNPYEEPSEEPSAEPSEEPGPTQWKETRWDFDNIDGWYYFTHNPEQGKQYYELKDGILYITTKGNTYDRNKLQSRAKSFGEGDYTFCLNVPEIEPHAQVSIGAFIYKDDSHELDFEIGYGKDYARQSCGAAEGDLVACMTNQQNPHNSTYTVIRPGWHECTIRLTVVNERYTATWIIDGKECKTLPLNFGPGVKFQVICSVENLQFLGDKMPTRDHTGAFDWVSVKEPIQ